MTTPAVEVEAPASPVPDAPQRVLNVNFIKLNITMFLLMVNMAMFNLLPHFLELRGASQGFYGAVAGSMGISNFAVMVLFGSRVDQWSRRNSVLLYTLPMLAGNAVAILALHADLHWYFVSRLLHGVFMGLGFPIMFAWVVELTPPDRKHETLALFGVGGLISSTLGPLIAELILKAQPNPNDPDAYLPVFIVGSAFILLALLVIAITPNTFAAPLAPGEKPSLMPVLRKPESQLLLAVTMAFGGMFGIYVNFGKNFVTELGLTYASVLFGTYTGGAILSRLLIRPITNLVSPSSLIPVGLLGVAATFAILSGATDYTGLAIAGSFYGLGHGILYPALFVRFLDAQKKSESGRSAILFQGSFSVGWGFLPYLGGYMVQATSFQALYAVIAAYCGLSMLLHQLAERVSASRRRPTDIA